VLDSLAEVEPAAWSALAAADPHANPFVSHAFLHALHETGCATARTGWAPRYLTLSRAGELVAAAPLYVKAHSYGEYVFDWAWADASERSGRAYYPKWLVAVPFTPVAGTRLLARDDEARAALADALAALAAETDLSSLHVLLAPPLQLALLGERGALLRRTIQFHWQAAGDTTFDEFLDRLAQPKRKKIRAERRKVAEAGVTLERRVGSAITPADWRFFHRCYRATYAAHGATPYLSLAFFQRIGETMPEHLMLVLAHRAGVPIAASLGVFDRAADDGAGRLYGRYWGALEQVPCLHFECCYYQMIDFAIAERLAVFEGGAQGAHKLARGLDPVVVGSAHWVTDPALRAAVARHVAHESAHIELAVDDLDEHRAFRIARGETPGAEAAAVPAGPAEPD
jgi:hypothetical protein